jgi:hypothetical protein
MHARIHAITKGIKNTNNLGTQTMSNNNVTAKILKLQKILTYVKL